MISAESQSKVIELIIGREPEAITRTLAMMAYNPAIGRVLAKGGVRQFEELAVETIPRLYGVQGNRDRFDLLHSETCQRVISNFKTNRGETLSYGQAQKPINVFLKVYVDWARQPTRELADNLAPFLHVPLDSLLMKFFARELREEYQTYIEPRRRHRVDRYVERVNKPDGGKFSRGAIEAVVGSRFSLAAVDYETYIGWQQMFRAVYPAKPVMLDIIWSKERLKVNENDGA